LIIPFAGFWIGRADRADQRSGFKAIFDQDHRAFDSHRRRPWIPMAGQTSCGMPTQAALTCAIVQVKGAILQTLSLLLDKGGIMLKPFLPQLQTTFMKALADSSDTVRERGLKALSKLVVLSTRVDPLATELLNGSITQHETRGVQEVRAVSLSSSQEALVSR
jgi:hypothetical protein